MIMDSSRRSSTLVKQRQDNAELGFIIIVASFTDVLIHKQGDIVAKTMLAFLLFHLTKQKQNFLLSQNVISGSI